MQLLDEYLNLQAKIYEYFGYIENWRVIPLDDSREYNWRIVGEENDGAVQYWEPDVQFSEEEGNYYEDDIYTQCHLKQWVYRGEEYTMICCDPHVDGNKFLRIFDNKKEIKSPEGGDEGK
jgi:hypothetical protein